MKSAVFAGATALFFHVVLRRHALENRALRSSWVAAEERVRREELARIDEVRLGALMAGLPGFAFMVDEQSRFVYLSPKFEARHGLEAGAGLGRVFDAVLPAGEAGAVRSAVEGSLALGGPAACVEHFGSDEARRVYLTIYFPVPVPDGRRFVGAVGLDITERNGADEAIHKLAGHLLGANDDERRRLARELHDTTAQDLTAIGLGLTRALQLAPVNSPPALHDLVQECVQMVEQSGRGVRAMSYLLHPPLLDEMGLAAALTEFVDGMARRSGLEIHLECPEDFGRLERRCEMALFRVMEAGVGIARRRGTTPVTVDLFREEGWVVLEVRDGGGVEGSAARGAASVKDGGGEMDLLAMKERMRMLGGELVVERHGGEATVRARVPGVVVEGAVGRK